MSSPPVQPEESPRFGRRAFEAFMFWLKHPVVRLLITALCLWLLSRGIDTHKVVHTLTHASPSWLIISLVLVTAAVVVQALIWAVLLWGNGKAAKFSTLMSVYLQGLYFSHVLPGTICGDAIRTVKTVHLVGEGDAIASIIVSRLAEGVATLILGLIAVISLETWFGTYGLIGAAAMVPVMFAIAFLLCRTDLIAKLFKHERPGLRKRIYDSLMDTSHAVTRYSKRPAILLACLALSLLNWGLMLASMVSFARAVGVDVSWTVFAIAVPISVMTAIAPFSFNGVGLREGIVVALLAKAGVDTGHGMAIALLIDVQLLHLIVVGAFCWLLERRSARRLSRR